MTRFIKKTSIFLFEFDSSSPCLNSQAVQLKEFRQLPVCILLLCCCCFFVAARKMFLNLNLKTFCAFEAGLQDLHVCSSSRSLGVLFEKLPLLQCFKMQIFRSTIRADCLQSGSKCFDCLSLELREHCKCAH